jgi:alcohol dehydrogenase (cytochrome c)
MRPADQPTLTCPPVRGATNWYSTAYNPSTRLYYVMTVEDCGTYRKAEDGGYGRYANPADPAQKILRAFNIETGKAEWQIDMPGPVQSNYAGVLTTAGRPGLLRRKQRRICRGRRRDWQVSVALRDEPPFKASPMTYAVDGRQYVAIASGPTSCRSLCRTRLDHTRTRGK